MGSANDLLPLIAWLQVPYFLPGILVFKRCRTNDCQRAIAIIVLHRSYRGAVGVRCCRYHWHSHVLRSVAVARKEIAWHADAWIVRSGMDSDVSRVTVYATLRGMSQEHGF